MKIPVLFAVLGMALAVPLPAVAADGHPEHGSGRHEWRPVQQVGPRATGPALKRVWVAAHGRMADCECDMMKMSAAGCMRPMHHMGGRSVG